MSRVAVIGGGITGLTAAYRLVEQGHEVTLFEAADRVGGVIQTIRRDGFLAECGPNTLLETSPKISQLLKDLDLEKRRLDPNPDSDARYILRNGEPNAMASGPMGFLTGKLFTWRAKLALLREPFIRASSSNAEESLAEFVRRRLGQEFLDYAINPFVAGIYAGDPHQLSVKEAFPKIWELEQKYGSLIKGQICGAKERKRSGTVSKDRAPKLSFDDGLQVLTDRLAETLGDRIRLKSSVNGLNRVGENEIGVKVAEETKTFDGVLLAMPAYRLAELEFPGGEKALSELSEVIYPPVASVVLGFKRDEVAHSLSGFGTLNPEVEKVKTLGTIFSSSLFPGRAPEGCVTLTSYVGGMRSPDLAMQSSEEIVALTVEDLRAIYGISGEPVFEQVFPYPKAIPQYVVGYRRFRDLMTHCEAAHPGIFVAGHCRDGISLADSIVSGAEIAERIGSYFDKISKA